jgi:hypothetical protein
MRLFTRLCVVRIQSQVLGGSGVLGASLLEEICPRPFSSREENLFPLLSKPSVWIAECGTSARCEAARAFPSNSPDFDWAFRHGDVFALG